MKPSKQKYNQLQTYKDSEGNIGQAAIISDDKGHAQAGWEIVSGSNSSTEDDYYGFTIVEAPTTLNIEGLSSEYKLNGSEISSTENLTDYFPTLTYQPCKFTKLTIDSGKVIVYKK